MPTPIKKSDYIFKNSSSVSLKMNKTHKYEKQRSKISNAKKISDVSVKVCFETGGFIAGSFVVGYLTAGLAWVAIPIAIPVGLISGTVHLTAFVAYKIFKSCYGAPFTPETMFKKSWLKDDERIQINIKKGWVVEETAKLLTDLHQRYKNNSNEYNSNVESIKKRIDDPKINKLIEEVNRLEIKHATGSDNHRISSIYQKISNLNKEVAFELESKGNLYRAQVGEMMNEYYEYLNKNTVIPEKPKKTSSITDLGKRPPFRKFNGVSSNLRLAVINSDSPTKEHLIQYLKENPSLSDVEKNFYNHLKFMAAAIKFTQMEDSEKKRDLCTTLFGQLERLGIRDIRPEDRALNQTDYPIIEEKLESFFKEFLENHSTEIKEMILKNRGKTTPEQKINIYGISC